MRFTPWYFVLRTLSFVLCPLSFVLRLRIILVAAISFSLGCSKRESRNVAAPYPNRPVKVLVPFAAGGGSDTFARVIAQGVKDNRLLPQPLVVINVPGAGGTIGSRRARDAPADGYTLLNLHDAILTAKHAGVASFGPEAFQPVAATGRVGLVVVVEENSAINQLRELMEAARAAPDSLVFAATLGAPSHFAGLLLEKTCPGASFRFTQLGGGAKRFGALKGGHVSLTVFSVSEFVQFQPAGLRALAYLGSQRHPALANVPTARELGFDVLASTMHFWWLPKGTGP